MEVKIVLKRVYIEMGISLELYRARIGLGGFAPVNRARGLCNIQPIVLRGLPLTQSVCIVISILLAVCGDVEKNPGPLTETMATAKDFQDLSASIRSMCEDIKTIKEDIKEVKSQFNDRITAVEKKTEIMDNVIEDLEDQIISLKSKFMEKNLVFWDIPETRNETENQLQDAVRNYIQKDLKINHELDITEVWRQGDSNKEKRLVIVSFSTLSEKTEVLQAARSSADHKRSVKSDLPFEIRQARRELAPFYSDALKQKHKPRIVGRKLLVNGKVFKYDRANKLLMQMAGSTQ